MAKLFKTLTRETITKQNSVKSKAWFDGNIKTVYVKDNHLNGATAFILDVSSGRPVKTRGRVYQDDQLKLYFLPNNK